MWKADEETLAQRRYWLPWARLTAKGIGKLRLGPHRVRLRIPNVRTGQTVEFSPEPGTPAAHRIDEIINRPLWFTIRELLTAAGVIAVPLVLGWLFVHLASLLRSAGVRLPEFPSVPFADFDLTDLGAPAWFQSLLDSSDYVTPLVIAVVLVWWALRHRKRLLVLQEQRSVTDDAEGAELWPD